VIPSVATFIVLVPISALCCAGFARAMRRRAVGQQIRDVGPAHHLAKAGTPTMGGVVVLGVWTAALLALAAWRPLSTSAMFVLSSGVMMGAIGAWDDLLSLRRRTSMGLSGWQKIGLVSLGSIVLFWLFRSAIPAIIHVPFSRESVALPFIARLALTWIVLLSATNAFNLTDGLDGLLAGVSVLVLIGLLLIVPAVESHRLLLPLIAVLLGFLWLNAHPARLFIGDVGSFGIGGIVGAMALTSGTALVLPILAGIPVLETISVVVQIASLRLLRVRLLRMSPMHHHFEASPSPPSHRSLLRGRMWSENQVVVRFWIAQAAFVAAAVWAARSIG
jgi:phospho-N-acetylmuramoyl-pentapeptide-transferase